MLKQLVACALMSKKGEDMIESDDSDIEEERPRGRDDWGEENAKNIDDIISES